MILYNWGNSIHDIRPFCRAVFCCHSSVVKYTSSFFSNETWRPNITEIAPLNLLAGSAPAYNTLNATTGKFTTVRTSGCVNVSSNISREQKAGASPASNVRMRAILLTFGNQVSSRIRSTTVREMKFTSQHCCDKTIGGNVALYRECCFPNYKIMVSKVSFLGFNGRPLQLHPTGFAPERRCAAGMADTQGWQF